jgi:hypothetical protein
MNVLTKHVWMWRVREGMRSAGVASTVTVLVLAAPAARAHADEPPAQKAAPPDEPPPPQTAPPDEPPPLKTAQPAVQPSRPLQVAGDPPDEHGPIPPPPSEPARLSDGAGPRITFGRAWTDTLNDGFYARFETEYFEVKGATIMGALLGLEGWGTEGATAGGGSIPITVFGGLRGGPFEGPKAPVFFFTLGVGIHFVMYDRIGDADGFGMLSPFAVATAGMEIVPGVRLLFDSRITYRWHWTAASHSQFQLGGTLGLNSYLWDGP